MVQDMIYDYYVYVCSNLMQLFSYAILGFALAEATGLFALMIAFLLLFAL
jgi:F0F1-type ATP synthase membrane subunit c/vacuolar-type H+-ATPase subunit K